MEVSLGNPIIFTLTISGASGGIPGQSATVALYKGGNYLDWNDNTFKSSGWGTKYQALTEADDGQYLASISTLLLSVVANDVLAAHYLVTGTVNAAASEPILVVGTQESLDDIYANTEFARKMIGNKAIEAAGNPGTIIYYEDDDTTVFKTVELLDKDGGPVTESAGTPAQRSRAT